MTDEKLTENFYLSEFLRSETAARLSIDNAPDEGQLANLRRNAFGMQQVRNLLRHSVHVSSGLRVLALNRAIGSKDTSAHVDGRATDFVCPGFGSPAAVCRAIAASDIAFDQLIHEHTWVHIAWARDGEAPRRQILTLMPGGTYALGIHEREPSRQAGFGVVHAVAAVAITGALTALFFGAKAYVDGVRAEALDAGRRAALLEVAERDNKQLQAVQARVLELRAELEAQEARHRAEVARIDQEGTHDLRKVELERDAARRAAREYAGRLRDPGRTEAAACPAGGGADPAAAALAGAGVDPRGAGAEAPGVELSQAAGAFLRAEADRADELVAERNAIAVRLEACQAIVVDDRRT